MRLEISQLNKHFGPYHAVQNLDFSVEEGETVALLGRNGAGKTTTIRMILGLLNQDSGSILWNGKPFSRKNVSLGYLPEERGLYPKMNVLDQLVYFGQLEGMKKSHARTEALKWIEELEISEYVKKDTGELSKGNQQKVQLIAAILHNPDIIILDEPFSGLDPVNVHMLERVVRDLIAKKKTLIFSSHRMESVESFCDKIYLMRSGKVVLSGTMQEIKDQYGLKYVKVESYQPLEDMLHQLKTPFTKVGREYQLQVTTLNQGLQLVSQLESQAKISNISIADPSLHQIFIEKVGS